MNKTELGLRITSALLQQNGKIAIDEIKAIPFVDSDLEADFIINEISKKFDVEMTTEKRSTRPFIERVTVIKLKS